MKRLEIAKRLLEKTVRDLSKIGFEKVLESCELTVNIDGRTESLPEDYLLFLTYKPPKGLELTFKFIESTSSEEWEGQVVEFMCYDESNIDRAVISVPNNPARKLLPISVDAGGNYTYMDLASETKQILDVGYNSGAISVVAPSFGEFLNLLVVEEE